MVMACVGTQIHSYISVPGGAGSFFDSPSSIKLLGTTNPRSGGRKGVGWGMKVMVTDVVD